MGSGEPQVLSDFRMAHRDAGYSSALGKYRQVVLACEGLAAAAPAVPMTDGENLKGAHRRHLTERPARSDHRARGVESSTAATATRPTSSSSSSSNAAAVRG